MVFVSPSARRAVGALLLLGGTGLNAMHAPFRPPGRRADAPDDDNMD